MTLAMLTLSAMALGDDDLDKFVNNTVAVGVPCVRDGHGGGGEAAGVEEAKRRRPGTAEVWGYGMLSVSIISLTSVMGETLFERKKTPF